MREWDSTGYSDLFGLIGSEGEIMSKGPEVGVIAFVFCLFWQSKEVLTGGRKWEWRMTSFHTIMSTSYS